jgi:hypothetical protein
VYWRINEGHFPTNFCHLLPLLNGIDSIDVNNSAQLVHFYDAVNSKEIYELNMKMVEQTQFFGAR